MNVKEYPEIKQLREIVETKGPLKAHQVARIVYDNPCSRDFYRVESCLDKMVQNKMITKSSDGFYGKNGYFMEMGT